MLLDKITPSVQLVVETYLIDKLIKSPQDVKQKENVIIKLWGLGRNKQPIVPSLSLSLSQIPVIKKNNGRIVPFVSDSSSN